MKYSVTLYQETYTTVVVEAESKHDATDKALMGEYEFVDDVTVKESDVEAVKDYYE